MPPFQDGLRARRLCAGACAALAEDRSDRPKGSGHAPSLLDVLLDASSMLLDGFSTLLDVQRATRRFVFSRFVLDGLLDVLYSTLPTRRYSTSLLDVLFRLWTWAKGPTRRLTRRPTRRFLTRRPTRRYSTSYSTVFLSLRSSSLFAQNISLGAGAWRRRDLRTALSAAFFRFAAIFSGHL